MSSNVIVRPAACDRMAATSSWSSARGPVRSNACWSKSPCDSNCAATAAMSRASMKLPFAEPTGSRILFWVWMPCSQKVWKFCMNQFGRITFHATPEPISASSALRNGRSSETSAPIAVISTTFFSRWARAASISGTSSSSWFTWPGGASRNARSTPVSASARPSPVARSSCTWSADVALRVVRNTRWPRAASRRLSSLPTVPLAPTTRVVGVVAIGIPLHSISMAFIFRPGIRTYNGYKSKFHVQSSGPWIS